MQFTPKTDTQIARESLREPGTYDFTVVEAEDTKSKKSGADMIKVSLQCFDAQGGHFYLTDYLMEAMAFKLRHFAYGIGAGTDYEGGMLNARRVEGRSGKVKVIIKEDKTGQYPPKNEAKDYVIPEEVGVAATVPLRPLSAVAIDSEPPFFRSELEDMP